jgi:hypothetical protein
MRFFLEVIGSAIGFVCLVALLWFYLVVLSVEVWL